jgi:hypothetical protein
VDVTGLVGSRARTISSGSGSGAYRFVVVGCFLASASVQIGSVAQTDARPHLILMDSKGYLTEHPIDLVAIEAKP